MLLAGERVLRGTVVEIQRKRLFIVHLQNVFKSLPESDLILSGDRVARRRLVRVGGRRFITLLALTKRCLKPVALRGQHLLKKWGPRNIRFRGPVFELEAFLIRGCPVRRRPLRRNIDRDLPETSLLLPEMWCIFGTVKRLSEWQISIITLSFKPIVKNQLRKTSLMGPLIWIIGVP